MKTIKLSIIFIVAISCSYAQTFNQFYADVVANTSQTNVLNDLTTFENFGIKTVGSQALTDAENWITSRYQDLGYTDIVLQDFSYSAGTSNNIIVTKTGTTFPNTYVIIDAHYDTINGPGTNDNGSGTVLLLELARLLKDIDTEYSIKFIHFSGEEDGLIGSSYYVNNTVIPQNLDIKVVFNIDEIGGVNGVTNNTITCERDLSNPSSNNAASDAATIVLANCMEFYSNLETEISFAFASDYIPFENNGEVITGLYETNVSSVIHTINDNLTNMDVTYAYEAIKGALGAAMEFAVAYDSLDIDELNLIENAISISPNPIHEQLTVSFKKGLSGNIDFKLVDILGKEVYQNTLTQDSQTLTIEGLAPSQYFAIFSINNKRFVKTIVVK